MPTPTATRTEEYEEVARKLEGGHYQSEDPWYSCPLSEDGCADDSKDKTKCHCYLEERVRRTTQILLAADRSGYARAKEIVEKSFDGVVAIHTPNAMKRLILHNLDVAALAEGEKV